MKQLSIKTSARSDFIDLTALVRKAAHELNIEHGALLVFVPHTTAGVTINENADPDVLYDIEQGLNRMVPWNSGYRHGEGNSAAHIKATLTGSSVLVPVENGELCLGTWQGLFFCEYDGPRTRQVHISAVGGQP